MQTDPRSANPGRFDAACQAFTTALGPYLLRASDLPAGKKWGELTPDELAALEPASGVDGLVRVHRRAAADGGAQGVGVAAPAVPPSATTTGWPI